MAQHRLPSTQQHTISCSSRLLAAPPPLHHYHRRCSRPTATRCRVRADATQQQRIAVIGAGVVGLTTAVRLLEALPAAEITLYASKFGSDVTTHGAAGVWQPYKLSETPEELTERWGRETFEHLLSLVHSDQAVQAGVQMCYCHCLFLAPEPEPFWASTVHGFRRMSQQELQLFSSSVDWPAIQAAAAASSAAAPTPGAFVDGYSFNTVVCEGRLYSRWLTQRLEASGRVRFVQRKLQSLAELAGDGKGSWDVVVNCSGLGAKQLLPDSKAYPIRGQIMRVKAPWVNQCVFAQLSDDSSESCYIIPNREFVVLGGTGQVGDDNTAMSLEDARKIKDRAMQVVPSLKGAEVVDHWVGLRPGRTSLRVEAEALDGSARQVVHCYGHGGSGLTLAWGTARDAVELAVAAMRETNKA